MENKLIIALVGPIASGKGTVAKYLAEKYNAPIYKFSTMLRDMLNRMYIDMSRENLQTISKIVRENFGQDVMSNVIAKDVENDTNTIIVVDGVRRPTDITYLKKLPGFHLIYIDADPKTRWERLVKRSENAGDAEKNFEIFQKEEQAESEQLIHEIGSRAQYSIDNNGDFDTLYAQVENILKQCNT